MRGRGADWNGTMGLETVGTRDWDEGRTDYPLFAMQRVCDFHRTRRVLSFPTMSGLPFPRPSISSAGERQTVGGVGTATRCLGAHWERRSPNRHPQNAQRHLDFVRSLTNGAVALWGDAD